MNPSKAALRLFLGMGMTGVGILPKNNIVIYQALQKLFACSKPRHSVYLTHQEAMLHGEITQRIGPLDAIEGAYRTLLRKIHRRLNNVPGSTFAQHFIVSSRFCSWKYQLNLGNDRSAATLQGDNENCMDWSPKKHPIVKPSWTLMTQMIRITS
jgi:hypothetical protein